MADNNSKSRVGFLGSSHQLVRLAKRISIAICLLFLLLFFLMKLPPVQNFLASRLTAVISKSLDVPVDVESVSVKLPGAIIIDDFYLEDLESDTLLFSKQMKLDIETGFLGLLRKEIIVSKVSFTGGQLNFTVKSGAEENNLAKLLKNRPVKDELQDSLDNRVRKPLALDVKEVLFEDMVFTNHNIPNGNKTKINLNNARIDVDFLDFEKQILAIDQVDLNGVSVEVYLTDWEVDSTKMEIEGNVATAEDLPAIFFDEELATENSFIPDSVKVEGFMVTIDNITGNNNAFRLRNKRSFVKPVIREGSVDYSNMRANNISFEFNDFIFRDKVFTAERSFLSFEEESGFVCEELYVQDLELNPNQLNMYDMELRTDRSVIGDTMRFNFKEYGAFTNFNYEVSLDARINNGRVAVEDVMKVAAGLRDNRFFTLNADNYFDLSGKVKGVVDDLRGRELDIKLGRGFRLAGDFSFQNLLDYENRFLNLNLDRCETSVYAVKNLVPFINLPQNFNKLGKLNFKGGFSGFFNNFNAHGSLMTELGEANMDMNLDVKGGKELANYRGQLNLSNFDLGYWTGNQDLGKVYFSSTLQDGKGLTANTASAVLTASIDSLEYRGYNYKDLAYKGRLDKNTVSGGFIAKDENFDLYFNGRIDFQPVEPIFDFVMEVKKFNLYALNISDSPKTVSGIFDIDMKNFDLEKVRGNIEMQNFLYTSEGKPDYRLDGVYLQVDTLVDGGQHVLLESEFLNAELTGSKAIKKMPVILQDYLWRTYPTFMPLLSKNDYEHSQDSLLADYRIDMDIKDTRGLMKLLHDDLGEIKNTNLHFDYRGDLDSINWSLELPEFSFGKNKLTDIYFEGDGQKDTSMFFLNIAEGQFGKRYQKNPMEFAFFLKSDILEIDLSTNKVFDFDNRLDINADLSTAENGDLKVHIKEKFLDLPDGLWTIGQDNELQFGKDYILAKDFVLSRGDYEVLIDSYGPNGLSIALNGFDLSLIDDFWDYKQMDFSGGIGLKLSVDDIMKFQGLSLQLESDTFGINEDSYGAFFLGARSHSLNDPFNINMSMVNGIQKRISAIGKYRLPSFKKKGETQRNGSQFMAPNTIAMDFEVDDLPMEMLEYWIGAGVSNTVGNIDAEFSLNGPLAEMILDGEAFITDAASTIDYLNVRYSFDDQRVALKEDIWEVIDGKIYDNEGNSARVKGGIRHEHLRNLSLDALITTDKLVVLDTEGDTDELYYGFARASGRATFTGTFLRPEFYITGTSLKGTEINIPVTYDQKAGEVDFVQFINNAVDSTSTGVTDDEPLGIQVNMEMNLTEDAKVKIIFDEQAGDILEGIGNGSLQMVVTRSGDFQMYGDYVVVSGSYLFTLLDFLVNKQFQVEPGGTIRWTGDPFGAELDLNAKYGNLKAPVGGLVAEYLVGASEDVKKEASYLHDVELSLLLSGIMTNPDVSFNFRFPNINGELKNYVDTKMRILSQDQNQVNLQVFGLNALGQFIPDQSSVLLDNAPVNFGINTVTEVLSQQFSIYLTQLVQQWLEEDGLVSGIDFDVAYKHLDERNGIDNEAQIWDQFQFRINNSLFEDRLSVNLGGNLSLNEVVGETDTFYLAGDYAVEYELNKNNLIVRFYQSTSPSLINGRVQKTGLGLSYKKDFDDFEEFLKVFKARTKASIRGSKRSAKGNEPEEELPPEKQNSE